MSTIIVFGTNYKCLVKFLQVVMAVFQLGFLTIYLSTPLTRGFTTGASMHVFTSQVKHIFGISVDTFSGPLKLVYVSSYNNINAEYI